MASIYGTAYANFAPNILGTTELKTALNAAISKTGEDLVLETKSANNVMIKANNTTVATFSANPTTNGLLTLATNAPSVYVNGNSTSANITDSPNVRVRNSNSAIELAAFVNSAGARFGTTTSSNLNIITAQSLRCFLSGIGYQMAFYNGTNSVTLDWTTISSPHTIKLPTSAPPSVDGTLTDTLVTVDNSGQLKYNSKFRCNSGATTNCRIGDGSGNATLDIDGSVNSANLADCPRFALINRQGGAGVSVLQNVITTTEGLAGTTTNHPFTLMANQVRVARAFPDGTFGILGPSNTVKFSANNATSNYTLSLPTGLPSTPSFALVNTDGTIGYTPTAIIRAVTATPTNSLIAIQATGPPQVYPEVGYVATIPANSLGANGFCRISFLVKRTNTTNDAYFGASLSTNNNMSTDGTDIRIVPTLATVPYGALLTGTNLTFYADAILVYANASTGSIKYRGSIVAGSSSAGVSTNTFDTTQPFYVKFWGSTTNTATAIVFDHIRVETVYAA